MGAAVTVLGMWERWLEPERFERRVWKQTIQAFGVDRWGMCDVHGGPFSSPVQYPDIEAMLADHPGRKTFLIPPGRTERTVDLADYTHPSQAIYVFGRGGENLVRHLTDEDDAVAIHTPYQADLYAAVVLAAVLHDRSVKR